MLYYQLCACGDMCFYNRRYTMVSKLIFPTRLEAEAYILEFKRKVTTQEDEHDLVVLQDNTHLNIGIIELEVCQTL